MTQVSVEPGIVAADARALADFYVAGLGFTVDRVLEFPQGLVVRLTNGDAKLKIYQPADQPHPRREATAWPRSEGFSYAALHVDNIQARVDSAVAAGAQVVTPVTNHRPGAHLAFITDPNGNVWEILQEDQR